MKRCFIILVLFLFLAPISIVAQDVVTMLNVIANVFNTRQEMLYDEAEEYLNSLSVDSIEVNIETEILFHTNKGFLYSLKYNDWEKSSQELDLVLNKIKPIKHLPEFSNSYKSLLLAYGYSLLNSDQKDKAISYFNKVLLEDYDDELDVRIYKAYYALANIYTEKGDIALSDDCHNKCQEFLVKSYMRKHPEHTYYLDNYKVLKDLSFQLEKQNKQNTKEYINTLCSLGHLLHKVDQGEYWESMLILQKAHKCAVESDLLNISGLEECYVCLQDIYIKYLPEPVKTQAIEGLIPYMIDFFSGILSHDEIYKSVASSYGANEQYEKAIEYNLKALNSIDKDNQNNNEKLQKIYRNLVMDYLGCKSDSTNQIAYQYLQKFKELISENDMEYYEWFLDYNGTILRFLYKNEDAIQCFKYNLSYYSKKYGKESDKYISTLNQLALCYPCDSEIYLTYLLQASSLIVNSKEIEESTIRGISVNLARNYIITSKIEQAKVELNKAVAIEHKFFGRISPETQDLLKQCEEQ